MAFRPGKCRLPIILRENKTTLQELSDLTGISLQQLSDYCHGRRNMSLSNAITIAFALEVPVEDLYEWVRTDRKRSRNNQSS